MNAESHSHAFSLRPDPLSEQHAPIPPFVKTIAVRLCWASSVDEAETYGLLSAPYHHGAVTMDDKQQLLSRFPFMVSLHAPAPIADYTIMLVSVWLYIEEMYHRGTLLPEEIMQGLMKKTATLQAQDCRNNNDPAAAISAPRS